MDLIVKNRRIALLFSVGLSMKKAQEKDGGEVATIFVR